MKTTEIKKHLINLKLHIDHIDEWVRQASDMVYQIEEKLMDIEDMEYSQKYEAKGSVGFWKEAASEICRLIDSPPRLNSSRCGNDLIAAAGFYQSKLDYHTL